MAGTSIVSPTVQAPSSDFRKLTSKRNFDLAWRRLMTSTEASYKWFWRPSASAANPIKYDLIKRLRYELGHDLFRPDHVCVLSEPKASGLMRHKSLLTFGDLLVYQAIANVIGPKLRSLVASRYGSSVFANNLTTPDSPYFFTKWQHGYAAYNEAQRAAFSSGLQWVAHFDLASYYDSIDHGMLEHLLVRELRVGPDVAYRLVRLLETWSSSGAGVSKRVERLYLNHGIPQGPQPSSMLAEVPFVVIDPEMERLQRVTYLRYADDVRIFAANEADVRYAAAVLDRLARRVGVFPSAGKCGIQHVSDIEEILKTVSLPADIEEPEDEDFRRIKDELKPEKPAKVLWNQLRDLVIDGDTDRLTLFKRLVSTLTPNVVVGRRLLDILPARPDLCDVVCSYLERLPALDNAIQSRCVEMLSLYPGYAYFSGRVLRVFEHFVLAGVQLDQNVRKDLKKWLSSARGLKGMRVDCQMEGVVQVLLSYLGQRSQKAVSTWLQSATSSPWALVHYVFNVPEKLVGRGWLQLELQRLLDHRAKEVSRAAALRLIEMGVLQPNLPTIDPEAVALFRALKMDKPMGGSFSRVGLLLQDLLSREGLVPGDPMKVDWRSVFGPRHEDFEKYCVRFLTELGTNKNGFILDIDAALEILMERLTSRKVYTFPNKNGASVPVSTRKHALRNSVDFRADYPCTQAFCVAVNDLRNRCDRAHSRHTASGTPVRNRSVYQHDVMKVLRQAAACFRELGATFPV